MFKLAEDVSARPSKARRKAKILEAASKLAGEVGYANVTMVDIAKEAEVGRMTLYRYYATKEHLFAELIVEWGREFRDQFDSGSVPGKNVGARVTWILRKTVAESEAHPYLIAGLVNSMVSDDPGAKACTARWEKMMPALLQVAMGYTSSKNQVIAGRLLHHTMISNMLSLNAGHSTFEKMSKELILVAKFTLEDVWGESAG